MPSSLLKISTILILSQFVFSSEQFQPCLGTTKTEPGDEYSFALAQVDDYKNPSGPQEACYYSCGAQVVTQSANKGDMAKLTLMDSAASFLTASGFLKVGESYYLNHLGMSDDEGGNGIGCIDIKPGNKLNHYPKSHPICSMAKAAVCGFWGQQVIPPQSSGVNQMPPLIPAITSKLPATTSKAEPSKSVANPSASTTPTRKPRPPKPVSSNVQTTTIEANTAASPKTTIKSTSMVVKIVPVSSSVANIDTLVVTYVTPSSSVATSAPLIISEPEQSSITQEQPTTMAEVSSLTSATPERMPTSSEQSSFTSEISPITPGDSTSTAPEQSSPTTEFSKIVPEIETISDILSIIDERLPSSIITTTPTQATNPTTANAQIAATNPVNEEPEIVQPINLRFKVNGRNFHVINKYESSLTAASLICQQIRASVAPVTSDSYQGVADKLKDMAPGKVIIGSWNGDSYSLTGDNCLILQVNHGISPGTCGDASAILCQSY